MKKLIIAILMTVASLLTTPSHTLSSDTIKLALAGTGRILSTAYVVHNASLSIPWLVLHWGSRSILERLINSSDSLLIQGSSKALIGYSRILMHERLDSLINACGFSHPIAALCHCACLLRLGFAIEQAIDGTKDMINGIAENNPPSSNKDETPQEDDENNQHKRTITLKIITS